MPEAKCMSGRRRDNGAVLERAAFRGREVIPEAHLSQRGADVVKPHVDVVLCVVPVVGDYVLPRAGEITNRHMTDLHIEVFDAGAVPAHVERIEVVDVDVLSPVIALSRPELQGRLTLNKVAGLHESLAEPEAAAVIECRQILRVRLDHDLRFHPRLTRFAFWVEP